MAAMDAKCVMERRTEAAVPPEVPARIAFDWEEGPNGGLIGQPNPLWNQSNSYWWESIPSASANAGILGSLPPLAGSPLSDPGPVNPHMAAWQSLALPSPSALPPIFPSAPPIGGWALSSPHWLKTAAPFGMNSGGPASPMSQADHDPFERAADRTKRSVRPEDGRQEGAATHLLESYLPHAANNLATLPQRALAAADHFHRTGEYNPGPVLETALMMVGTPATPKGALGSGAGRGKGASLPMDEASRISRSRQMGMSDERFYRGERGTPSEYTEPTHFTRDREYADGIARRYGQPEAREFRLVVFNPANADQRKIFLGIGAGAAAPFFGSGSLDAIPQADLNAYLGARRRGDTL
jgi:hypothetical protein